VKKFFAWLEGIFEWFGDIFTDALGRPEVKMILGVPTFIAAIVYVFVTGNIPVAGFVAANALTLMGFTALADAAIDRARG
jgi:hypothetical protein